MDTVLIKLEIEELRAKLELSRIACEALEREYYAAGRSREEMKDIAKRWGETLKIGNAARIRLDQLGAD